MFLFVAGTTASSADDAGQADAENAAVAAQDASEKPSTATVFFLSNRESQLDEDGDRSFSGDRGQAAYGRCTFEFSPIPLVSDAPSDLPFYLKRETSVLTTTEVINRNRFWNDLDASVEATSSGSVVLFIHGYNYGFERTCLMAAQLQRSLHGQATVVAFSWPSDGSPSEYVSDLADVEWSVPLFAELIRQVSERYGPLSVQVVAHSLGSRGAVLAMLKLVTERRSAPAIERLVLLAPDFDAQTFADWLPGFNAMVGHISVYASDNDTPLKLSEQLSGHPRLGQGGENLTVIEGVETIDVSSTGRYQITGHEYFIFNPLVGRDLVTLLGQGLRASGRSGLVPNRRNGLTYWTLE